MQKGAEVMHIFDCSFPDNGMLPAGLLNIAADIYPSELCPGVEKTSLRMYFPHWLPSQKFSRIQGCSCKSPYGVWEHVLQTSGYYTPSRNHDEQCRLFLPPESNKENGNEIIEEERDRRRRVRFFQRLLRTRQMR